MVKVRLRLFGAIKERMRMAEAELELPAGARVAQLLTLLADQHPEAREFLPALAVSVNLEYASPDFSLKDGDEVGLIPPVSGGDTWSS